MFMECFKVGGFKTNDVQKNQPGQREQMLCPELMTQTFQAFSDFRGYTREWVHGSLASDLFVWFLFCLLLFKIYTILKRSSFFIFSDHVRQKL
ncbi:MAG: hypothetical protein IGS03_09920 [Candidatus Sericytochromatia bacterium]|nr:hypothetical protein [Candidatus Sericytochromatia bacterium]